MSNVIFKLNKYAILFNQFDEKIQREYMMSKYPETVEKFERLGQRNTNWDKKMTQFIKENPSFFKNRKIITKKNNIFREFTSRSVLDRKINLFETLENVMRDGYDVSEEELQSTREIFPKIELLMKTQEFEQVLDGTRNYKNELEKNWTHSEKGTELVVSDILRHDIVDSKRKVDICVMPTTSLSQRNYPINEAKNAFFLGQPKQVKESSQITSIAHANVHHLLPFRSTMTGIQRQQHHAFIKFISDKELFYRMTGKSYLYNDSKDEIGKVMGQVYPYWLGYLHRGDENPVQAIRRDIERDKKVFDKLKPNSKKRELYSDYDFRKLSPEKIAEFFRYRKGITPYEFNNIDFSDISKVYKDEYLQVSKSSKGTPTPLEDR